ncbi:hypothetical protein QEZ47_14080 [Aminobacter anthyllidis]|uniref:hypothetical protein n=1 Tax=Aminobacter anthyllidis TaxID=1035067 RepID=UPI002457B303|nr:hypothetical protein [Aminobacter anthyllidis]MDH4986637.1 hypothetical protein [Aminobacter anthyllidis]
MCEIEAFRVGAFRDRGVLILIAAEHRPGRAVEAVSRLQGCGDRIEIGLKAADAQIGAMEAEFAVEAQIVLGEVADNATDAHEVDVIGQEVRFKATIIGLRVNRYIAEIGLSFRADLPVPDVNVRAARRAKGIELGEAAKGIRSRVAPKYVRRAADTMKTLAVHAEGVDGEVALGIPALGKRHVDARRATGRPQRVVGQFAQPKAAAIDLAIAGDLADGFLDRLRRVGGKGRRREHGKPGGSEQFLHGWPLSKNAMQHPISLNYLRERCRLAIDHNPGWFWRD